MRCSWASGLWNGLASVCCTLCSLQLQKAQPRGVVISRYGFVSQGAVFTLGLLRHTWEDIPTVHLLKTSQCKFVLFFLVKTFV